MRVFAGGTIGESDKGTNPLRNEINALIKVTPESFLSPSTLGGHNKKIAIYEQEVNSHQMPNLPVS